MSEIPVRQEMYEIVRHSEVDPRHPLPGPDTAKTVRSGRSILQAHWSICTK